MAIDTQAKRRATLAVGVIALVLPLADGTIAVEDRGHVSYIYGVNVVSVTGVPAAVRLRLDEGATTRIEPAGGVRLIEGATVRLDWKREP